MSAQPMNRKQACDEVARIMGYAKGMPYMAVVRPRSHASQRYAVAPTMLIRTRYYLAYGSSWEEAIERLEQRRKEEKA